MTNAGVIRYAAFMPREVSPKESWIGVRVPKWAHERLKEWAAQEEDSVSRIIRKLILQALEEREKPGKDIN